MRFDAIVLAGDTWHDADELGMQRKDSSHG